MKLPAFMQTGRIMGNISADDEFDYVITKAWPYLLRVGRAFAYGLAGYLLAWLQPHFDFSFLAFGLAIFLLSLLSRGRILAEAALVMITISVFVPAGLLGSIQATL